MLDISDKLVEKRIIPKRRLMAQNDHLFTGPGDGDIQFAVDKVTILFKTVGRQKVQLIAVADGKRVDDDIALGTLVALHRVNAHLFEFGNMEFLYFPPDHRDLIAVGNDDAYRLPAVKARAHEAENPMQQVGYHTGFGQVHLIRKGVSALWGSPFLSTRLSFSVRRRR